MTETMADGTLTSTSTSTRAVTTTAVKESP